MKKILWFIVISLITIVTVSAQELIITGTVKDAGGESIPGVSVLIKGTQMGTATDINGQYKLTVPSGDATLIFSFVGLKTTSESVQGRSVIDVVMTDDLSELEEVMIVAYGTTNKKAFTGAAEVVNNETIENRPVTSFEKALQGTTAGLLVTSGSGQPGSTASVRIRGIGSLSANSSPLYVLDGVPITGGISDLNPNDIESVTVLKDAAASSLYGSRAANGVIMITTKKGTDTKTRISFSGQVGVASRISEGYDLMNSTEFYEQSWTGLYNQALLDGKNIDEAKDHALNNVNDIVGFNPFGVNQPLDDEGKLIPGTKVITNTDWRDVVYKTGLIQNYNLNVMGGSDVSKFYFSLGYYNDDGTVISSNFERITNKIDLTHQISSFLTVGISSFLTYSSTNAPPSGSGGANPVRSAEVINAASPIYNEDGTYNWDNKAVFDFNPVGLSVLDKYSYNTKRAFLSTFVKINFTPRLSFKTTAAIDYSNDKGLNYYNPDHGNGAGVNGRSTMSQSDNAGWNISNILTYTYQENLSFLEVLGGIETIGEQFSLLSAGVTDFSVPGYYDLIWGSKPESPGSYTTEWNMISFLGQVKYDYDQKYFASASLRSDGSSRFGKNNKYGIFYSIGAGWIVTGENWMPSLNWLNNLKIRASYGTSGNNNIGNYASLGLYGSGANYGGFPGLTPVQLANNNLSWEKISSLNVGLDAKFFGKLDLALDYYNRKSDGLLFAQPLSAGTGFSSILTNLGAMVNSGIEATLNSEIINNENLFSSIGFNISSNTNKILNLTTERIVSGTKLIEEGNSVYQFYMREWAGVNPDNGKPMWYVNNDSDDKDDSSLPGSSFLDPLGTGRQVTSEYTDAERTRLGFALPDVYGGLNYSLGYKNFDFSFYVYYSLGGQIYNVDMANNMHDGTQPGVNLIKTAGEAWTPNNRFTNVPRYVTNNIDQGNEMSSRYLENASYVRIKNITLSYNLDSSVLTRMKLSGLKVFISAENLFTFTSFSGFDPEGALSGTTNNNIPGTKVVTIGLKVDL